jgi:hypothetical protein
LQGAYPGPQESDAASAATPEAQSALVLVTLSQRFEPPNVDVLSMLVVNGAAEIGATLTAT